MKLILLMFVMSLESVCNAASTEGVSDRTIRIDCSVAKSTDNALTQEIYNNYKTEVMEYVDAEICIRATPGVVTYLHNQMRVIVMQMKMMAREVQVSESITEIRETNRSMIELNIFLKAKMFEIELTMERLRLAQEKKNELDKFFSAFQLIITSPKSLGLSSGLVILQVWGLILSN